MGDLPYVRLEGEKLVIDPRQVPPLRELIREDYRPVKVKGHEDDFMFLLLPMEQAILHAFRRDRNLRNLDVLGALKEVVDGFPEPPGGALAKKVHEAILVAAAMNRGRISDMEILACIHRLRDSVKCHGGSQGYLFFLDGVMP